ncbi:DUF6011 domain-containing protein [Nocardia sp. NPDC047654]|uniref:DUF6011 domain-containing protein n=1 Tax=Nocardia sp. NPDC047654 TaxID=3364314 RepID=UPI00371493BC
MAETGDQPTVRLVAHCRRCHDRLRSPRSVAQGIGPTCAIRERVEIRAAASRQFRKLTLFDVMAPDQMNDPLLVGAQWTQLDDAVADDGERGEVFGVAGLE